MCSFFHTEAELTLHVFHKCSVTKILWNQLLLFFETDLDFPDLTPQTALFGFINESDNNLNILQNHMLLIFELCVYQAVEKGVLNLNSLIKKVTKVKKLETKIAPVCNKKTIQSNNKWKSTDLEKNYCLTVSSVSITVCLERRVVLFYSILYCLF